MKKKICKLIDKKKDIILNQQTNNFYFLIYKTKYKILLFFMLKRIYILISLLLLCLIFVTSLIELIDIPLSQKYYEYCKDEKNNIVLNNPQFKTKYRKYSMKYYNEPKYKNNSKYCKTNNELLHSIKYGTRIYPLSLSTDPLQLEDELSYFQPQNCIAYDFKSEDICSIFDKYDRIFLFGDSLSRHIMQGLALHIFKSFVSFPFLKQDRNCMCDGQFSETGKCRDIITNNYNSLIKSMEKKCAKFPMYEMIDHSSINVPNVLSEYTGKKVLIFIQGGYHFHTDINFFYNSSVIKEINKQIANNENWHSIYIGLPVQSRQADLSYPHQSRENTCLFNTVLESNLKRDYKKALFLDIWNLTKDAQMSNANHYLTEVNYNIANIIINFIYLSN